MKSNNFYNKRLIFFEQFFNASYRQKMKIHLTLVSNSVANQRGVRNIRIHKLSKFSYKAMISRYIYFILV